MTSEEVKQAVRDVLHEERDEFWIPQPEHYTDHCWIQEIRIIFKHARTAGWLTTITLIITAVITVLWVGFKVMIKP